MAGQEKINSGPEESIQRGCQKPVKLSSVMDSRDAHSLFAARLPSGEEVNRAGPSTDNMKRECAAICAGAPLDQQNRGGGSGRRGPRGLWGGAAVPSGRRVVVSSWFLLSKPRRASLRQTVVSVIPAAATITQI